ncbi:MAG TPA: FkbM family methyltransferase [Rhodothermales bacterium]|nr:FkbM family methyltransferase [Rhodothermales bacterium]
MSVRISKLYGPDQEASHAGTPDTTVLIPFYDRIEHFRRYLREGRWDGVGLQLVCDGSAPEFVQELRSLVEGNPDIAIHAYEPNRGSARARAEGIMRIQTPYVCLCDDDDFVPDVARYVGQAAAELKGTPDLLFVTAPFIRAFEPSKGAQLQYDRRWLHGRTGLNLLNFMVRTGEINALHLSATFRTEDLRDLDVNDIFRVSEDMVMLARLCARYPEKRISVLPEGRYMRLVHDRSISAPRTVTEGHFINHALALCVGAYHLAEFGEITREAFALLLLKRGRVLQKAYGKGEDICRVFADILLGREPLTFSSEAKACADVLRSRADELPWEFAAFTRGQAGAASGHRQPRTQAPVKQNGSCEASDVTFVVRFYDRFEHFSLYWHTGLWEDARLQIVCDGSTPEFVEELEALVDDRERVAFHTYSPNRGAAHARHIGFQHVTTRYTALCGDDDFIRGSASYAQKASAILDSSSDVLMVAVPHVTAVNPLLQPVAQWGLQEFHGKTALEALEMVVRSGQIRALGVSVFRTEDVQALDPTDLFRNAEDVAMLVQLCARFPEKRIHVLEEGTCDYIRLVHTNSMSQPGTFTPEKIVRSLLAFSTGAYYLIGAGRMELSELPQIFASRGRVFQAGNGVGVKTAAFMTAFLQGREFRGSDEEVKRARLFLEENFDQIPAEVMALREQYRSQQRSPSDLLEEGEHFLQQGDYTGALASFEQILEVDPAHAPALCDTGLAFAGMGLIEEATVFFERALQSDPSFEAAFYNLLDLCAATSPVRAAELFGKYAAGIPDSKEKQEYVATLASTPSVHEPEGHRRVRIAIVCGPDRKFIQDIETSLTQWHDVRTVYYDKQIDLNLIQQAMDWADVTWFEWCDAGIVHASQKLRKTSKVVCRLHSYEAFTNIPATVNWPFVDTLVFVAPHIEDALKTTLPALTGVPTRVIYNGVDLSRFQFEHRSPGFNLAFVGRIHSVKNPALLLQCVHALVERDSRYALHIAGQYQQADSAAYFQHMVNALGLSGNVFFHGWIDDINGWLADKQYIISTSIRESFGYNIAEAMARGIKPVIHNFPGATLLYPKYLVFNTVNECVRLVMNGEYDSEAYRAHIETNYSLERQISSIEHLIQELTSSGDGVDRTGQTVQLAIKPIPEHAVDTDTFTGLPGGASIIIPRGDFVRRFYEKQEFYEKEMLEYIQTTYGPNRCFVDVGANIGNHTLYFSRLCNAARVDAFEPSPVACGLLRQNIAVNRLANVHVHQCAVGAQRGQADLGNEHDDNLGCTRVLTRVEGAVRVETLDDVLTSRVDLMKIDVEGMAAEVISGASSTLKLYKPDLFVECAEELEYQRVMDELSPSGYLPVKRFNYTPTFLFKHLPDSTGTAYPSYEEALAL